MGRTVSCSGLSTSRYKGARIWLLDLFVFTFWFVGGLPPSWHCLSFLQSPKIADCLRCRSCFSLHTIPTNRNAICLSALLHVQKWLDSQRRCPLQNSPFSRCMVNRSATQSIYLILSPTFPFSTSTFSGKRAGTRSLLEFNPLVRMWLF